MANFFTRWFNSEKDKEIEQAAAEKVKEIYEGLINENKELRDSLNRYKTGARTLGVIGAGYGAIKGYDYYKKHNSKKEQYKARRKKMI